MLLLSTFSTDRTLPFEPNFTPASVGEGSKGRGQMDTDQSLGDILVHSKTLQTASRVRSTTKQEVVSGKHVRHASSNEASQNAGRRR